jgi:hypothetical protein
MNREHQSSGSVPRTAVTGVLVALLTYTSSCLAANQNKFDLRGSAVLTIEKSERTCSEVFLLPSARTSGINLGEIGNGKLKMDWEFSGQLTVLRERAVVRTQCQPDGSFDIQNAPSGPSAVVAHFFWLRGKWVTGGSIVEEFTIPSGAPLRLKASLAH